ncbi:MAG: PilT protein-like protein [Edaphobacter sp.]|nr:PilT protein-like protein [Edaphobacter sp.]
MEWLKPLLGHTVGLDTAPLIYFIEKHPVYLPLLQPFFEAVECGDIEIVTSTLTLTEVLVHPLRRGDQVLARQYSRILLNASHVQTLAVSPVIASEAAHLRASRGYKTPDAIQLATAQSGHATFFVTNDEALSNPSGLQIVVLKNLLTQP